MPHKGRVMPSSQHTPEQSRWQRFFNRWLYDRLPALYNAIDPLTFGTWWRLVRHALDYLPPGGAVLEIGFGPGRLHLELARRAERCAGLDLAWGMCRFTRRRLDRAGLDSLIVRGTAYALPFPAGCFDAVISTFAVSGMPDAAAVLREVARVLTPGGRVILIDIGLPSDGNRAGVFWARLWERMGDFLYDQPALMRAAGLEVIAVDEYGPGNHIRAVVGCKPAEPHQLR
ncbi:MAG: hypothetical protein Kow00124_20660 [Anaerolineae bacterium]